MNVLKSFIQTQNKRYISHIYINSPKLPGIQHKKDTKKIADINLKTKLLLPKEKKIFPILPKNKRQINSPNQLKEQLFKLTLKEKNICKSMVNMCDDNEIVSDTTISEDKKHKCSQPYIDKITIFYEIEKNSILIQRFFRGYLLRKSLTVLKRQINLFFTKKKTKSKLLSLSNTNNDYNNNSSLNSSICDKVSHVSIDSNEIDKLEDESLSDLEFE